MDDYYCIFDYSLSYNNTYQKSRTSQYSLSALKYKIINPNADSYISDIKAYENLNQDITEQRVIFKKVLQQIVRQINLKSENLINITFISEDVKLFTQILPKQCKQRGVSFPFLFTNFVNIKDIIRSQFNCPYKQLYQICEYLGICTRREAEAKGKLSLLQKLILKLVNKGAITSTQSRYLSLFSVKKEEQIPAKQVKYKYFRIRGLPFKIFPQEVSYCLAPELQQFQKQLLFINQRDTRFSGRAIIKVPDFYQNKIIQKNRMYIGSRYVEIEAANEVDFQKVKLDNVSRSRTDKPDIMNPRRRQRSRSNPSRSRSRQQKNMKRRTNPFEEMNYVINSGQYGIKIRGLPFSFSEWDVENIFNPYNLIGGSVKLGIKAGTSVKNGQAVLLVRSYHDAQRALQKNGYQCMNRYLEIKIIQKDYYNKYR